MISLLSMVWMVLFAEAFGFSPMHHANDFFDSADLECRWDLSPLFISPEAGCKAPPQGPVGPPGPQGPSGVISFDHAYTMQTNVTYAADEPITLEGVGPSAGSIIYPDPPSGAIVLGATGIYRAIYGSSFKTNVVGEGEIFAAQTSLYLNGVSISASVFNNNSDISDTILVTASLIFNANAGDVLTIGTPTGGELETPFFVNALSAFISIKQLQ
jgi:hypothetical protein